MCACLFSEGTVFDTMAHMKADAEFSPPPKRRIADDAHTSWRGNICGNAPRPVSKIYTRSREEHRHTNNKDFSQGQSDSDQRKCQHLSHPMPISQFAKWNSNQQHYRESITYKITSFYKIPGRESNIDFHPLIVARGP